MDKSQPYYLFRGDEIIWTGESPSLGHAYGQKGDLLFGSFLYIAGQVEYKAWRWAHSTDRWPNWIICRDGVDVARLRTLILLQT